MKRMSEAPRDEAVRLSERRTDTSGTFPKPLTESRASSAAYSRAIELISSKVACTDMRDLLRVLPELFGDMVKVEIELARSSAQPIQLLNALVDTERVLFTSSSERSEPFESRTVPLALMHGGEAVSIGQMRVLAFRPLSLDQSSANDAAETEKVLGMIGSLVAKTIDASLDGLTALPVRKYFDRTLAEKSARFSGEGKNFSLIIIDLDHFKRINDGFGHAEGDRVLSETAMVLMNGIRGRAGCMDTIFRIGGEEFGVLLPDVHLEEAARIAERLRRAIKLHDYGLREPGTGAHRRVTCSVGLADAKEAAGADDLAARIYKMADFRLYQAKGSGRDSVVSMKAVKEGE